MKVSWSAYELFNWPTYMQSMSHKINSQFWRKSKKKSKQNQVRFFVNLILMTVIATRTNMCVRMRRARLPMKKLKYIYIYKMRKSLKGTRVRYEINNRKSIFVNNNSWLSHVHYDKWVPFKLSGVFRSKLDPLLSSVIHIRYYWLETRSHASRHTSPTNATFSYLVKYNWLSKQIYPTKWC